MSSEKTANLGMHKWMTSDYVKMAEFNENFKKIDDQAGEIKEAKTDTDGVVQAGLPERLTADFGKVNAQLAEMGTDIGTLPNLPISLKKTSLADAIGSLDLLLNGDASPFAVRYAKAEKKVFELRSESEFDIASNASISLGQFSTTSPGVTSGKVAKALSVGGSQNLVIQARIYWDGTQDSAYIGTNISAAGQLSTDDLSRTYIGFSMAGGGFVLNNNGSFTVLVPSANLTPGWYQVTLFLLYGGTNPVGIASLQKDGSTMATSIPILTGLSAPNNIQIECFAASDKIQDLRYGVLPDTKADFMVPQIMHAKNFHTPIKMTVYGVDTICHLPASYNPLVKNKFVIFCHGSGGLASDLWLYANENSLLQGILDAGYVVIASDYSSRTCWGNAQSQTDIQNLINHYKSYFNLGNRPYLIIESMGGTVGLNAIAKGIINPKAVIGIYPACNLQNMYDAVTYAGEIETAYGFSGAANFATATSSFDPLNNNNGNIFAHIPMKFWASSGDTIVTKTQHSDAFATKVNAAGGSITVIPTVGNHGDASNFVPADVVDFFSHY